MDQQQQYDIALFAFVFFVFLLVASGLLRHRSVRALLFLVTLGGIITAALREEKRIVDVFALVFLCILIVMLAVSFGVDKMVDISDDRRIAERERMESDGDRKSVV